MSEKIFKRKIYERMLQWKQESDGQTALLIKGARRIGKSTIAEEFARREYDSYINIDFSIADDRSQRIVLPYFRFGLLFSADSVTIQCFIA